jgi:predicted PurR-regulated permease PerM
MTEDSRTIAVTEGAEGPRWRAGVAMGIVIVATVVGLLFLWFTATSLLIIFAGILFAAFLDACTRALKPILPIGRSWRLSLVILIMTAICVFAILRGTVALPEQTRNLVLVMDAQLDVLQQKLLSFGIEMFGPEGGRNFSQFFPEQRELFGHAQFAVGTATSFIANAVVILFVGLLFAFDPASYRDGVLLFVPIRARARGRQVLNEMGQMLRYWLIGQSVRMLIMGLSVWFALYLLNLPGAFLLGVQAGLLNFIPYLGPIVAAAPVALVAMPLGTSMLIWAVGIYTFIQTIEGYVIGPLIQKRAAQIPPAWTLVSIVLLGSLFGTLGIALALPLLAVGRIAALRFYVEDWLGDKPA